MILNETSYFGAGCRETIAVEAARRGFKKAFFVTDRDLIRFKVADKVIEVFEKNSIPYELFSDVKANPTTASTAGVGSSKQIEQIAPAVYGPTPGRARTSSYSRGNTPPCCVTITCAAFCRFLARL